MSETTDYAVLFQGAPKALQELQGILRAEGMKSEIVRPPEGSGGG